MECSSSSALWSPSPQTPRLSAQTGHLPPDVHGTIQTTEVGRHIEVMVRVGADARCSLSEVAPLEEPRDIVEVRT